MTNWQDYAKFKDLRAVIDPSDNLGYKNRYINLLHHKTLIEAFGESLRGKRLLDLGCGIGRFTKYLNDCKINVIGVDSCQEMLDQNTECKTICAPVTDLPFDDNYFDAILSVWTLQFLSDSELRDAAKEIDRVLVPGGLVHLIEQVSLNGYDGVSRRLPANYKRAFGKYKWTFHHPIVYSDDTIIGLIRRGIVPEPWFDRIASYQLSHSRNLKIRGQGEYTDYIMVMRKDGTPQTATGLDRVDTIRQEPCGAYTKQDIIRFRMIAELCKGTVLDIGCGECELKKYLPPDCQYTGVDLAPSENVICGSAYKLDFPDQSFDTTLLLNVLEHLENPLLALTEIRRVTKEKFILCVPNPFNTDQIASVLHNKVNIENTNHINLFGDNEIRNLCFNAGFDNVHPIRFYTKVPGLNWLSPIRSCFGQWAIYEVT